MKVAGAPDPDFDRVFLANIVNFDPDRTATSNLFLCRTNVIAWII
jgi:hypothetical protein